MRVRSLLGRHGIDALIVALAVAAVAEAALDASQRPNTVTIPFALLWTLPFLLRRRFPLAAPVGVLLALSAEAVVAGDAVTNSQLNGVVILAAFGALGAHPDLRSAVTGAAVGYASIAAIIVDDQPAISGALPIVVFSALAWAIGRTVAQHRRRTDELAARAERLERAHETVVHDERTRIARELHDVIAHSVSVMTVQAGAARLLLDEDPAQARESLLAVEETGREALAEMRRLVGILRSDEHGGGLAPQPGIAELDALVEHVRAAGLPVDLVIHGERRPLPPGVDLAAYRVVQEALTNTLKHAGAARAEVTVRYEPTALELSVANDGVAPRNGRGGHGLVGMRERVSLYGGELEAGARSEGGFAVRARLPTDASAP